MKLLIVTLKDRVPMYVKEFTLTPAGSLETIRLTIYKPDAYEFSPREQKKFNEGNLIPKSMGWDTVTEWEGKL